MKKYLIFPAFLISISAFASEIATVERFYEFKAPEAIHSDARIAVIAVGSRSPEHRDATYKMLTSVVPKVADQWTKAGLQTSVLLLAPDDPENKMKKLGFETADQPLFKKLSNDAKKSNLLSVTYTDPVPPLTYVSLLGMYDFPFPKEGSSFDSQALTKEVKERIQSLRANRKEGFPTFSFLEKTMKRTLKAVGLLHKKTEMNGLGQAIKDAEVSLKEVNGFLSKHEVDRKKPLGLELLKLIKKKLVQYSNDRKEFDLFVSEVKAYDLHFNGILLQYANLATFQKILSQLTSENKSEQAKTGQRIILVTPSDSSLHLYRLFGSVFGTPVQNTMATLADDAKTQFLTEDPTKFLSEISPEGAEKARATMQRLHASGFKIHAIKPGKPVGQQELVKLFSAVGKPVTEEGKASGSVPYIPSAASKEQVELLERGLIIRCWH